MASYTVRKGQRYRATLSLGWVERLASNEMVAERIGAVGFVDVEVMGEGGTRHVTVLWPLEDTTAEIPSQIISIIEIEV
jgi:hypothetical protein